MREAGVWKGLGAKGSGLRSGKGPRRRGLGLASPSAQPARPSRCSALFQPKPALRRQQSRREEAGRAPRPRRPRSQGQLHSSLQTVTSSPAHPSLRSPLLPSPPRLNCWLHLSECTRESRRRPTASGDLLSLLARCAPPPPPPPPPPGCGGEPSTTRNASHARHSPGSGCCGPEGVTGLFSKCCKTPTAALCIATLPPANAATLAPHFKARLGFPGLFPRPTGALSNSLT